MTRSLVAVAALCIALSGCGSAAVTAPTPTVSVIDMSAASIQVNASTRPDFRLDITAVVLTKSGAPVTGQSVALSVAHGTITPATGTTDAAGAVHAIASATSKSLITATTGTLFSAVEVLPTQDAIPIADLSVTMTAPSISYTGTPAAFGVSLPVSIPVTITGWSFGDGQSSTSSSATITHTYTQAGTYTASVSVADATGRTATANRSVLVSTLTGNTPPPTPPATTPDLPTVTLTSPSQSTAGVPMSFGLSIANPDELTLTITGWTFGDGATSTAAVSTIAHTYAAAGTYAASVSVRDNLGRTATGRASVTVSAATTNPPPTTPTTPTTPAPTVTLLFPSTIYAGQATVFGVNVPSTGSTITITGWDFGDGATSSSSAASVSHTYASAGTYPAAVTVRDDTGRTASSSKSITVTTAPTTPTFPAPDIVVAVTCTKPTPMVQSCTAAVSYNGASLNANVTNVTWHWDDGSADTSVGSTTTTAHPYTSTGTFTVKATVTLTVSGDTETRSGTLSVIVG